jgi:hypothetical protein
METKVTDQDQWRAVVKEAEVQHGLQRPQKKEDMKIKDDNESLDLCM